MQTIELPTFMINYPNIFTPRLNELNGKDEFSCVAVYKPGEKEALKKVADFVQGIIEKKWGKEKSKHPKNLRSPFRKTEDRASEHPEKPGVMIYPEGLEAGGIFITLRSTRPVGVVDGRKQNARIVDQTEVYSGALFKAIVSGYAYEKKGNAGVSLGLIGLQKVADGKPIAGSVNLETAFTAIETSDTDFGGAEALL